MSGGSYQRLLRSLSACCLPLPTRLPSQTWRCFRAGAWHPLTGELRGFWSLTVTGNWRLIFRFEDGEARDVDLVDYH